MCSSPGTDSSRAVTAPVASNITDSRRDHDTAKANVVWNHTNSTDQGNFHRFDETLYITESGRWFLHGEGGALTTWASYHDGGRSASEGEDILSMTDGEVRTWMEHHKTPTEIIEKHFKVIEA